MTATLPRRQPAAVLTDSKPEDAAFLAALGRQVRESRERRGLARKAVSQSAGVSERYLAQLEAGEGNASVLLLRSVARRSRAYRSPSLSTRARARSKSG